MVMSQTLLVSISNLGVSWAKLVYSKVAETCYIKPLGLIGESASRP